MSFKRLKDNLLSINNLRKFAGYQIFNLAAQSHFKLEIPKAVQHGNILVLSPHPDDDAIGCGATLRLHAENNSNIKIVYLTDGSNGAEQELKKDERKKLIEKREQEAKDAAELLGVSSLTFWRYEDGQINNNKVTQKLLTTLISSFKPDIIYTPSFLDPHPDHYETCKILYSTLKSSDFEGEVWSYEVWSPIYANRIVNVDKTFDKKELAILAHKSQLADRSYLSAIRGLNQYRAGMFNVSEYAEAFFACNRELYIKLFELINFKK
ncbi:MAG: PIG-L family deacetylase [bacterium]